MAYFSIPHPYPQSHSMEHNQAVYSHISIFPRYYSDFVSSHAASVYLT